MPRSKITVSPIIHQKICDYYDIPEKDRPMGRKEFRMSLHIGPKAFQQAHLEWKQDRATSKAQDNKADRIRDIMEKTLGNRAANVVVVTEHRHTPKKDSDADMKENVIKGLYLRARDGDHNSAFRLAQMMGWIIDKKEILVGQLTADDIARRNTEADKQLTERGHRVAEVQEKPALLLGEVCEDTGQVARDSTIRDTAPHRQSAD